MGNSKVWILWTLISLGLFSIVLYIYSFIVYHSGLDFGFLIFGVLPLSMGLYEQSRMKKTKNRRMEKQLLRLAMEHDQMLTISEIVLYTEMDQKTAEQVLDELRIKGLVKIKVADNGVWVYEFEPLLTKEQKLSAERV
ncbi:hypothetical protein [Paenibacillus gallinarum]|uniref:HTH marR-type domain-containing protein n=1 Tax=Paenibacillus gallinarum TaxID=2762232 RepID=A0ABR8SX91_9BACL|nr:hypothetical protein [Paenibacillus gallinarum]MBD7968126.1 hypothetical protein [Paenibacillus gallinarum]